MAFKPNYRRDRAERQRAARARTDMHRRCDTSQKIFLQARLSQSPLRSESDRSAALPRIDGPKGDIVLLKS
jgi:hypothetical protein